MSSSPATLSNAVLVAAIHRLVDCCNAAEAELVVHLGDADARRLYADQGCSSMHAWCVNVLKMSEGAAFKRIGAARLARRFPEIVGHLAAGRLHLCGIALLAPHLTEANRAELLAACGGKTKRAIEKIVADLAPRPDAPTIVRRLPTTVALRKSEPVAPSGVEGNGAETAPVSPVPPVRPLAPTPAPTPAPAASLTPLGAERYRVQFTADQAWVDKLREATALASHSIPDGSVAAVLDRALTLLCEQLRRDRFAERSEDRERRASMAEGSPDAMPVIEASAPDSNCPRGDSSTPPPATSPEAKSEPHGPPSRHIPAEVRRAVVERDGGRCSFVAPDGRRCGEVRFLQFHHIDPWARGGANTAENIALRCRTHNALQARLDFGAAHVDAKIHARRAARDPTGDRV